MRISAAFPSKYLKATDLQSKNVTVAMSHVTMESINEDERPVLYFKEKEKGLVLNKTNANTIATAFGDDTENWRGGEIILFETMVDFQGKTTAAIRCRVPPRRPEPRTADPTTIFHSSHARRYQRCPTSKNLRDSLAETFRGRKSLRRVLAIVARIGA